MAAMQLHGIVFGILLRPRPQRLQTKSSHNTEEHSVKMLPQLSNSNMENDEDLKPMKQKVSDYSRTNSSTSIKTMDITEASSNFRSSNYSCTISVQSRSAQPTESMQISPISEDFTPRHQATTKYSTLWKYLPWVLFFFGNWLVQSCHVLITVLTPVRAHWFGIENHLAALLISIYGVSSGVSR